MMSPKEVNELLLLKIRNAIADKEWYTACANMQTDRGGWTCDWKQCVVEADARLDKAVKELEEANK